MTLQISGQITYLSTETPKAAKKRIVLRMKNARERYVSQGEWKGMAWKRIPTTPVPIVMENHEGEKLRTIRRQP